MLGTGAFPLEFLSFCICNHETLSPGTGAQFLLSRLIPELSVPQSAAEWKKANRKKETYFSHKLNPITLLD